MQKLTYIFIGIVLLLFVLSGLYIRSSESEKQVLRAQLAAQQVPESSSRDLQEEQVEEISSDDTASAAAAPQKPLGKMKRSSRRRNRTPSIGKYCLVFFFKLRLGERRMFNIRRDWRATIFLKHKKQFCHRE